MVKRFSFDFECGMIVGARQGGFSISETSDLLDFHTHLSLEHAKMLCKKQKTSSKQQFFGQKQLMRGVRGELPDLSKLTGR